MSTERLWDSSRLLVRVRATRHTERKMRDGRVREGYSSSSSSRRLRRMDTTVEMSRQHEEAVASGEEEGGAGQMRRESEV
jgi:hypothetical protein